VITESLVQLSPGDDDRARQNTFDSLDGRVDFELAIEFFRRPFTTVSHVRQLLPGFSLWNFPFQLSVLEALFVLVKSRESFERVRSAVGRIFLQLETARLVAFQ